MDIEEVMGMAYELEAARKKVPQFEFLRQIGPKLQVDKWGTPFPLSATEQDRFDRLCAVIAAPAERGRALLHAGMLVPDEVMAIAFTSPIVYAGLVEEARADMIRGKPPFPSWAEASLTTLFGRPAAKVYGNQERVKMDSSGKISETKAPEAQELPTQAERRDMSVREKRS